MNDWTMRSNPTMQTLAAWFCTGMGATLLWAFRHYSDSNTKAGFVLGLGLLVLGLWALLTTGTQSITISPRKRRITITDINRLGRKERVIRFDDITRVGIGYLGKRSNFMQWYYLNLHLRSGESYALFAPGRFYEGASNSATAEGWRDRLERDIVPQTMDVRVP